MSNYTPYHVSRQVRAQDGWDSQYAVRIGGTGGRIIGDDLDLDLEQARDAGREEGVEA